jgi:hypothetical protein
MLSSGPMRNSEFSLASPINMEKMNFIGSETFYMPPPGQIMKAKVNKYMLNPILHNGQVFFLAKSEG